MVFREAKISDSQQIAELIYRVALPFKLVDFTEVGWQFSCEYNTVEKIRQRFSQPNYITWVCEVDGTIIGLISVLEKMQISQLFVDATFRKRGVAKRLWREVLNQLTLDDNNPVQFSVKSSSFAVKFYEKIGFQVIGERQCSNGIWFIPMTLS
ncbi:GNAT family N-acetyltransferase [Aliikangiella marina]|uniref:GNAT family N-acetyltransferase n=1 Tax=Aliikangiella marina TaxID=1712262 RepID=A0A545TCZ5_9GAMM|nr:GNAT family N-acetyltransferase [Aliikangiella marina]TQV75088.1 GNAT family N-acetyltransferase [Aliikangiella marina]